MRLGEVAADVTAATIGVKCWAANDRVSWQIEARSVIIAARESAFDTSFRSMLERSTVSAMIHDVEAKIHKL
jgi:hypothetical protein